MSTQPPWGREPDEWARSDDRAPSSLLPGADHADPGYAEPEYRPRRAPRRSRRRLWLSVGLLLVLLAAGAAALFFWLTNRADDDARESPAPVTSATPTAPAYLPSDIAAGDCFDGVSGAGAVGTLTEADCLGSHDAQALAVFDLAEGPFPGAAPVAAAAQKGCSERVPAAVGARMTSGELGLIYLAPQEAQWVAGDRGVSCLLVSPTGEPLTSVIPTS